MRSICKSLAGKVIYGNSLRKVAIFPGDGIGPEISNSVIDIFAAAQVPIEWEFHQIHKKAMTEKGDLITEESLNAVR